MQSRDKKIILLVLILGFTAFFAMQLQGDLGLIFKKDLLAHDESSNSVVAANVTRQFFPPAIRVNPLNEKQGIWMEGPQWQHIPPVFAYIPYLFFKLDGKITIEVKRLSYALVDLLTGILFILVVYRFSKSLFAASAAFLASILWLYTPFSHELITGYAFGVSDIILAFTTVCAFAGLLEYLRQERTRRSSYSGKKLALIAFLVVLPILTKNLLGAIPATAFFILLIRDKQSIKTIIQTLGFFIGYIILYFLPLLVASPTTFKNEILVSFFHFKNLEGWARPWHYYLTNYLPQRYLFKETWAYFIGLILSIAVILKAKINREQKILLGVALGWFIWNLLAISLVKSKIPNFLYQSYLFSLFAITYSLTLLLKRFVNVEYFNLVLNKLRMLLPVFLILVMVFTAFRFDSLWKGMQQQRAQAYSYNSEHEKFYQVGEWMQQQNLGVKDLTIINVSSNDCWFRYYILFLTGAESKTLLEMNFTDLNGDQIKEKYDHLYFVVNKSEQIPPGVLGFERIELSNYSLFKFDLSKYSAEGVKAIIQTFLYVHQDDILKEAERIKKDKTSCQWLVPDPILNAP